MPAGECVDKYQKHLADLKNVHFLYIRRPSGNEAFNLAFAFSVNAVLFFPLFV